MASIEDANSNGERPGIPVLVRLEEEREADNSACTDLEMLAFICRLLEDFFLKKSTSAVWREPRVPAYFVSW